MLPMMSNNYRNAMNWMPGFFSEFFDEMPAATRVHTTSPAINVTETDKDYRLDLAVPGITRDMASVQLTEDGNLMVRVEARKESADKDEGGRRWLRREFSYSSYSQAFSLPDDVDRDAIRATVTDGILSVELPKRAQEALPASRQIQIG